MPTTSQNTNQPPWLRNLSSSQLVPPTTQPDLGHNTASCSLPGAASALSPRDPAGAALCGRVRGPATLEARRCRRPGQARDPGGKRPELEPGCSVHHASLGKLPNLPCLNVLICHPQMGVTTAVLTAGGLLWGLTERAEPKRSQCGLRCWGTVYRSALVGTACHSRTLASQSLTHAGVR